MGFSLKYRQDFKRGLFDKYAAVANRLPPGSRILEVGCHTGDFGRALIERGYRVWGIENNPEAVTVARSNGLHVVCADIEDSNFWQSFTERFDRVLLMDVLEHLRDPQAALGEIKRVLNEEGRIIVTGPNVANWTVRKNLIMGRWEYGDGGILDRTHLHFYTGSSWHSLVSDSGYRITAFESAGGGVPIVYHLNRLPWLAWLPPHLHKVGMKLLPGLFTVTFLIEAVPLCRGAAPHEAP